MLAEKSRSQEIRVGLFVLVALALVLAGSLWIAGGGPLGRQDVAYSVRMKGSGGVRRGDRVRVSGVQVGRVEAVALRPGEEWPVEFRITLDEQVQVRTESSARITSDGLLGSNYLEIVIGAAEAPRLGPGEAILGQGGLGIADTLDTVEELAEKAGTLLDQVGPVVQDLAAQIKPLTERATLLLSDQNLAALADALAALRTLLVENGPVLASLLERLDHLAGELEAGAAGLPELSEQLSGLASDLRAAVGPDGQRLAEVLDAASATLATAQSTLGSLGAESGELEVLLEDLQATVSNLESFSQTLADRPWALVRKSKAPERSPGDPE